jgi:PAS domain S-box-containing protein
VKALSRLHELAMRLAGTSEPQPALQAILDTLVDVHGADFGLLSLYDPAGDCLLANASVGFDAAALAIVAKISPTPEAGACGSAFATKTRAIAKDAQADPREPCTQVARAVGFRGVHSTPILTSAGEVLGILSVHFKAPRLPSETEIQLADLCARHAADAIVVARSRQLLRESEARFARFMQHLPGLAWIKDISGRYVFANDAAHKAFQTTPEKLYGKSDPQMFDPETAAQFELNDLQALGSESGLQTIETLEHGDGTLHHSLVNKLSIPGVDGEPAWVGGMAIDITDRRRIAESLRSSEQRFRTLASHAPVGIFQTGPTGETVFVNESWCAMSGLAAERALGRGWLQAVHPDDRKRVDADWEKAVRSGVASEAEFRFMKSDGQVTWLQGNAVPLRNLDGALAGYIGTVVDITARKTAEIALRESEQRFRHMADHAPVMIWVTDGDGSCTFLGKTWYEFTGRTPETSLGFGWVDAVHPDDRAIARDSFLVANAAQRAYRSEYRVRNKNGEYHWVIDAALPRFAEDGRFLGFIGSVIDITERKLAEEALRTSEQLYRAIGESIDYGVWTCDPQGHCTYASESFLKLVGMTQEQCAQFGWGNALHPDDAESTIAAWRECVRTGGTWDVEHRFLGADGKWHPILARGVPVRNEQGEVTAWAGINLDISRLKQVEEELRDADHRKDEFLAVLAHELRNPLAPIRTGLELMRLAGDDPAAIEEVRATMDRQSQQMVRLIDDLLDVSRITRGTVELRICRVELSTVIENAVETARPIIEEMGHKLDVTVPKQPIVLEADGTRLSQVIANLLNNAAKYMDRGGRIELVADRQQSTAVVTVRDSGIGIPPEMIDRIFDMFTQVDGSLERAHGGLGIGLTLVKRLVEMHDGSVEVHSAGRDQGSEFTVRLPAVVGLLSEPVTPIGGARFELDKRRILVVDDNETAANVLAMLLKALGNEVRTAFDGLTAIDLAEQFRPDIVLLDIGMPKLNGYETARRIRAQPWGRDMVLAALTGWGQEEDKRRTREAGFDHHFVKPVEPDVLQKLLAEHEPSVR